MPSVLQRSFSGGEIAPSLAARTDQIKYQTGLATCRNFFTRIEGGASNRSGHKFIAPLHAFANTTPRMIPFIFNNEQAYTLVFSNQKLWFIRDGAPIFETAKNITGATAANPVVITSTAHGFNNGDLVYVSDVVGMTEINGRYFTVASATANTFALQESANVDGSAYTAYSSGGTVKRVYSVSTPYTTAQLSGLRYAQSADVLKLTHASHQPYQLERTSDTSWSLTAVTFTPDIEGPAPGTLSGTAGSETLRYRVTAISSTTDEESLWQKWVAISSLYGLGTSSPYRVQTGVTHGLATGDEVVITGPAAGGAVALGLLNTTYTITVVSTTEFSLDGTNDGGATPLYNFYDYYAVASIRKTSLTFPASGTPVTVTWSAVTGAASYKIYRETNGIYAYVGDAENTSFEDLGYTAYPDVTPPYDPNVFNAANEYPSACGYFQQRFVAGGSISDPEGVKVSRIGLYNNFTKSRPIQDSDSFGFTMASSQVNAVKHFVELGKLVIFTLGAEWTIEGDEAGTLRPNAINPRKQSENGSSDVPPIVVNDTVLYVQALGNDVAQLTPNQGATMTTRKLTTYSPHLFEGKEVLSWSWARVPYSIVWTVQDDGTMLGLTYLREQEIEGWHRHDTGDGDNYLDVCCIPELADNQTATYVAVQRNDCNGETRTYIERMANRTIAKAEDGRFLDSYLELDTIDNINADPTKTMQLYQAGDEWYVEQSSAVTAPTLGDGSPDIGRMIVFHLADGSRVRCLVESVWAIAGTPTRYGYVVSFLGEDVGQTIAATDDWSEGVTTATNLWHLEGREVYALLDGYEAGPFTVTNGTVIFDAASIVVIGLQIIAQLETLAIDIVDGETIQDKQRTVSRVTVPIYRASGIKVGLDEAHLNPWKAEAVKGATSGLLKTGRLDVHCAGKTDYKGTVVIRQDKPLPVTVLGVIPTLVVGGA